MKQNRETIYRDSISFTSENYMTENV